MSVSKQYATGLALVVISVCSQGPRWLDLIVAAIAIWLILTDKEVGNG